MRKRERETVSEEERERERERETVSEEERERVPFSSTNVHFISSCQDFSIFYGKVSSFFGGGNHALDSGQKLH